VDLRFPTSRASIGSDAVNKDPDYSAAYCVLSTDSDFAGHGLTLALGRGTELCVLALEYLSQFVTGRLLSSITQDFFAFSRQLTDESQFRSWDRRRGSFTLRAAH
jgi:L-fuconate dehydratase